VSIPRHALLLAAGLGTRLRPLTDARAKPAIPVAGEPMIRRIIRWLAGHQVGEVIVNLHHLPHTLTGILGDGSDLSVRVRYSWEQPRVLGSAGGPRQALAIIGADPFLIVNGDTLTDVDVTRVAAAHQASGALVTLALVPNRDPLRYGGVHLDGAGHVIGFAPRGAATPSFHFVGVQLAAAEAFQSVPPGVCVNSIGDVYDAWIRSRPGSIRGYVSEARFWDVGTLSDYWTTSAAFRQPEDAGGTTVGRRVRIDSSARVTRSILWDDIEVEAGVTLDECIVTDGVRVPAGSNHRRAVLMRSTTDGEPRISPLATGGTDA
jgi:NDP-sugar pyrophosphorylase family protein